jgi:hypothetical protein
MDCVRYEQHIVIDGKRGLKDVAFHDIDTRSLRLRGQSLPRDGTVSRQFKQCAS